MAITIGSVGAKGAKFTLPAKVQAGVVAVTVRNTSSLAREAQLIRVEGDHSAAAVARIIAAEGGPIPSWLHAAGGVTNIKPNTTAKVTQRLVPGMYYLADTTDPEFKGTPAKMRSFAVTPGGSQATLPTVTAQITARDYAFEASDLKAGTNAVHFQNTGKELHHALMFPMRRGATIADARKAFQSEREPSGPPPVNFAAATGTAALDGGAEQVVELNLKRGRYAAVCFIQDRAGGPPHVAKGMVSELTVK